MAWRTVTERSKDMAVHAVLLPGGDKGKVLYFGGFLVEDTHGFDVDSDAVTDISLADSPGYNAFCSGHAFLTDGRVMVAGGQLRLFDPNGVEIDPPPGEDEPHPHGGMGWGGERKCSIFNPLMGTWSPAPPLSPDPAGNPDSGGRWYPTVTTLPGGEVLAVGGHPDRREEYPAPHPGNRHSNNTPERFGLGSGKWTLLAGHPPAESQLTALDPVADYDYQRNHLLPDGRVFFSSPVRGRNRFYEPYAGTFVGPEVDLPSGSDTANYRSVWAAWTSVMLPLLHRDGHRPRVLLMGDQSPRLIDLGDDQPQWQGAGLRQWGADSPPKRHFLCPVILPTGQVFFSGGSAVDGDDATKQANPVLRAEVYTPGINWNTREYDGSDGIWSTQTTAEAADVVPRHYHSTALLLPTGAVWTAGSNGPSDEGGGRELRMQIFEPDYGAGRPTITGSPPNIGYLYPFEVTTPQAQSIERVALIRCGSVTHGFNFDQRYVDIDFEVLSADTLRCYAPPDGAVAPPGWYMLWIVDSSDRPCEVAPFIRLSKQKLYITADVSTYSVFEVEALGPSGKFEDALWVILDGFLPGEAEEPERTFVNLNGDAIAGIETDVGAPQYESDPANLDAGQRIAYPLDVRFTDPDAVFAVIPPDQDSAPFRLHARVRDFTAEIDLTLSRNPNPRMSDGNPQWLSIDVCAFKAKPGQDVPGAGFDHPPQGPGASYGYIQSLVEAFNEWPEGQPHPFDGLPTDQEENHLALYGQDSDGDPIYNYALARVRLVAPEGVTAENVRVFFRLWTTGWTSLGYDNDPHGDWGSYRRHGDGPTATPLLGIYGDEINNVPCFAEPRVANMEQQTDETNLVPTMVGTGSEERYAYFGCWLDMNDPTPRFPREPGAANGPFSGDLKSIQQLMNGLHQCLVAEIHYTLDPIPIGADPGSSDNLAQRNLLLDESDNPGGFGSHLVHHTLEIEPSPFPFQGALEAIKQHPKRGRRHPDELCIEWGNLPRDSHVTLFMPQLDVDEVLAYAARRGGPATLSKAGPGAIACRVGDASYIPIPGPLDKNIASLLTVQLPPGVGEGQRFSVVIRQVDGRRYKVVGTSQFDIRVRTAEKILPRLERNLSVLRHIALSIPPANRWHPVFERYLEELGDRVRAMGGEPDSIRPSWAGDPAGGPERADRPGRRSCTGRVCALLYDCHGRFEGFVLDTCPGEHRFRARERAIEEVLRRACREESRVTVWTLDDPARPHRIFVHCP